MTRKICQQTCWQKLWQYCFCADIGMLRWPPPDSSHDILTWTSVSLQISLLRWISGVLCTYVSESQCWKLALTVGICESRLTLRETSCDFYRFHIMEGAPSSEYSSWSLILFKCVQYKHARYCQVESWLSLHIWCKSSGRLYSTRVVYKLTPLHNYLYLIYWGVSTESFKIQGHRRNWPWTVWGRRDGTHGI